MTAALADDDVRVAVEAWQGTAAVGTVTEAGARGAPLAGRRVLVGGSDPCGDCDVCRRGGASVCPRARMRELGPTTIAAARWVVPLGEHLALPGPSAAAVAGDVALAYTLYARTNIAPRDPVVVVGVSAIARFLVEVLLAKGVTPVVTVDADAPASWSEWLRGRGAIVADATDAGARQAVEAATVAQGIGSRPWRVLATTPVSVAPAAALAGPRATLTLLAPVTAAVPAELVAREVMVLGVARAHPDLVVEAAALCVKGEVSLDTGTTTEPGDPSRALLTLV